MKELYEIKFYLKRTVGIESENELNEKIVHEVINNFDNESKVLKGQKLLIYFGMRSKYLFNKALGILVIYGTDEYMDFIDMVTPSERGIDRNYLETFKYIIYLSSNIRECNNKKNKIFTIAHELQHVLQNLDNTCLHKKHSVLFWYFILKELETFNLPKERDAIRKAKIINYRMFKKTDVDNFIEEKINEFREDNEKLYWETTKSIDVDRDYDWKDEVKKFWNTYKEAIEKETEKLKKENGLEENERDFLSAYNYYLSECK